MAAFVALLTLDALLRGLLGSSSLSGSSPGLVVGLLIALVAFAVLIKIFAAVLSHPRRFLAAIRHPRRWVTAVRGKCSWGLALGISLSILIVVPAAVARFTRSHGPPIRSSVAIPGRIDLVIVSPARRHEPALRPSPPPADLAAWDLRYSVAVPARGRPGLEVLVAGTESRAEALRALRTGRALEPGGSQIEWRPGARRAVVLDIDEAPIGMRGSGVEREPDRPRIAGNGDPASNPLVAATSSLSAPTFVLLDRSGSERLDSWAAWAQEHKGEADAVAGLEGPTLLDAGLRLVSESRTALADRQLAYAYRPLLFFDRREPDGWPVDIGAAFAEGDVEECKHVVTGDDCTTVRNGADLEQSFDYLHFDQEPFTAADRRRSPQAVGSAYYYHVVPGSSGSDTFIDYWWYLPYNPSLSKWMCAPGFSVPDVDCFDHESDWEGVTVEVGVAGEPPPYVFYAYHSEVVRLSWGKLKKGWRGLKQKSLVDAGNAHHPLVFVARDSHASYRNPCSDQTCFEYGSVLPEGEHNGAGAWRGNEDKVCAGVCLKPLPITRDGKPATWNAFSGPWGSQRCILWGTFCDRGEAPQSPAFQWRYNNPGKVR